jgi:hypothetical protein
MIVPNGQMGKWGRLGSRIPALGMIVEHPECLIAPSSFGAVPPRTIAVRQKEGSRPKMWERPYRPPLASGEIFAGIDVLFVLFFQIWHVSQHERIRRSANTG